MSKKAKFSVDEVKHVAKLANVLLTGEEIKQFGTQLSETIDYIEDLNELATEQLVPTSQVTGKENELRDDEIKPCLSQEEALKNANSHNGFFVSKITWN